MEPLLDEKEPIQLYKWQIDCIEQAKKQNTIAQIPTGGGKTMIAVRIIDYFRSMPSNKSKRALFIVPTLPLIEQQAKYCRENCQGKLRAAEIHGEKSDSWKRDAWEECIQGHDLLVGTPGLFKNALSSRLINIGSFFLIIFDECHHVLL